MAEEWFTGTVKAILPEKGFGFVACDESFAQFGADAFLHSTQLPGLEQGMVISFKVKLNARGKPQATDVSPASAPGPAPVRRQVARNALAAAWQGCSPSHQTWQPQPRPHSQSRGADSGYSVAEAWLDAVRHGGAQVGVPVVLSGIAEATGDHEAVFQAVSDWLVANSPSGGLAPPRGPKHVTARSSPYGGGGGSTSRSKTVGVPNFGSDPPAMDEAESGERRYEGEVSALKPPTADGRPGFGFAKCPAIKELCGDDVFLHSSQAELLQVGQFISFEIQINKSGRPQAVNVMAE